MANWTKAEEQAIIEETKRQGQKWLDAKDLSGKPDIDKIQACLDSRTFEGEPVMAVVVRSPKEAVAWLKEFEKTEDGQDPHNREVIKNAYLCVWNYYLMAFYESSCSILPDKNFEGSEFIYQSLFPAYEAGLGFLICLGPLVIGVCMPEAHLDEDARIHRESGPAIVWGDDKYYWWHGTEVPAEWIEDKENVDPSLALTWDNVEQRRALSEILGWDKVLELLDCNILQEDGFGELMEVDLPDAGQSRFVRVKCATGRVFCLPVPNEMNTAHQAVAWSYGITDPDEYDPEVRT